MYRDSPAFHNDPTELQTEKAALLGSAAFFDMTID
jgi:hypothetical protein